MTSYKGKGFIKLGALILEISRCGRRGRVVVRAPVSKAGFEAPHSQRHIS